MINKAIRNYTAVSNRMNKHRILMLVLMIVVLFVMGAGVGEASDVNQTLDVNFSSLAFITAVSGADIGLELATNESYIPDSETSAQNTIGNDSYDILITDESVSQNSLYPTLNEIYDEIENQEVLYLKDGYTITIADINKYASSYEMLLVLEKNSIELDNKIVCSGEEYSWHNANNSITSNVEIFVGTSMDVVFFKNVYLISNENTIIDNETFTIIYSGESSGSLNLNTADYNNIEGFTTLNENMVLSSSFPPASGYSQEFLKENYSLTVLELDVDGNEAWISLSKNGGGVDSCVVSVGESYNYNSLLSFKLDKVFVGTSRNYIEITNIYQCSEIDSSVIVQNESALLLRGLPGKFILTEGGLEWQLEENYKLHAIDIDISGDSREALLLITKDGTHVDYTIINVSDSYTYYKNENLILTADVETIFSGEGGVSLVRLHHVYQYSEDTGDTLLSDTIHLYSVGNTREVEWQLNQNYSLSAMDIDSKDIPRQVWLRLNKDGNTLEEKFLHSGDNAIFYNSGTKILDLNVGTIFDGKEADLVFISDVYQYSETDENDILIENEPHIFIFGSSTGNDWQLSENYTLSFMDIDIKKYPNQVWLRMKKNGVAIDDNVVAQTEDYKYYNNTALLFEGYIKSAFGGRYLDMLTLTNASQYSELDSTPLIADVTYSFYPENVEYFMDLNEKLSLDENYIIVPVDIQGFYYPDTLWLRLYKDDVMVDEVILLEGQDYSSYSGSIEIISTTLETIFMGMNVHLIKFEDFNQYSEVDGSLIKSYGDIILQLGSYSPPTLTIISPINGTTVSTSTITVSGTATDDTGVTSLTVDGNPVTIESDGSFSTTVSLTSGINTITVIATDAAGSNATEILTITMSLPNIDTIGVYNNEGTWALWNTTTSSADIVGFGWLNTKPVVGDWDGDGVTEVGIYNTAGNNFLIQTDSGFDVIGLGWDGVTPVVGDWNGDGNEEVGVYNNEGTWALWNTTSSSADIVGFGWADTQPVVGDWDGDGITEVGIYNTAGNNFLIQTDAGFDVIGLGWDGVTPVAGDWNGDGNDEVGVYNNEGTWALWNTTSSSADIIGFGWPDTQPVVGDWDGDGVTEVGIYNTGGDNFFLQNDSGASVIGLGWSGVTPVVGCWS